MSLSYTYKWQPQPYVAWKGPSTNSVTPTWSQPLRNGSPSNSNPIRAQNASFKARPIKHWRKQLQPRASSGVRGARPGVGMPMDVPAGSIYLGADSTNCNTTDCSNGYALKENILINGQEHGMGWKPPSDTDTWSLVTPNNAGGPPDVLYVGSLIEGSNKTIWDPINYRPTCIACNPENNRIRRKVQTTIGYKTDYQNYLKSRNKTYKQNLPTGYKIAGGEYFAPETSDSSGGWPIYPNQVTDGSGGFPDFYHNSYCNENKLGECNDLSRAGFSNVPRLIAKPNNRPFAQQGAVSSSTRLLKLKVDTVTQNANNLSAWGQSAQNAARYSSRPEAPFILKSKNNICFSVRRSGNHTNCFLTPTGNIGTHNRSA